MPKIEISNCTFITYEYYHHFYHRFSSQQIRQTVLTRVGTRSHSHSTISQNNKTEEEEEDDSITPDVS